MFKIENEPIKLLFSISYCYYHSVYTITSIKWTYKAQQGLQLMRLNNAYLAIRNVIIFQNFTVRRTATDRTITIF